MITELNVYNVQSTLTQYHSTNKEYDFKTMFFIIEKVFFYYQILYLKFYNAK